MAQEWAFDLQKNRGQTVTVGDMRVTPENWALIVRWPNGGFVWSSAKGLWVERPGDGDENGMEHIRIIDITRIVEWSLYGISLLFGIMAAVAAAQGRTAAQRRERSA